MAKQVLIVIPRDHLGGAEQIQKKVAKYLVTKEYRVTILFFTKPDTLGWNDLYEVDSVELIFSNHKSTFRGIFSVLKHAYNNRNVDYEYVISSHVFVTGVIGFLIKIGLVKKHYFIGRESTTIFSRYEGLKLFLYKIQYYIGYSALDLLICQTTKMKGELLDALPWLDRKIKIAIINNPIDLVQAESLSNTKVDFSVYGDYIISAGRLIPEKGFDILIESFAEVSTDFPLLNLVILGRGDDRDILLKLASELGLEKKVFLPGFVENVFPYFKNAQACIVSSRIEGFPNILLQMMSQNDRVVSTLCAGDIDKISGIVLAEPNNTKSLTAAIYNVIRQDITTTRELFTEELSSRSFGSYIAKIKDLLSGK